MLESGEPREVHHFATLIGYGASAINPYLMLDTVDELAARGPDPRRRRRRRRRAQHRQGDRQGPAQDDLQDGDLDDPVLLRRADLRGRRPREDARRPPLHRHGVAHRRHRPRGARPGGARPPRAAWPGAHDDLLPVGGIYAWRRDGEHHMWNPETIALLQHAVRRERERGSEKYREYARMVNEDATRRATLRGLLTFRERPRADPARGGRAAAEIVKRFATGAMSLGSISHRGARDARDRDEPPRRPVEHGRGRGGPAPLPEPENGGDCAARRSSRSPPAASA